MNLIERAKVANSLLFTDEIPVFSASSLCGKFDEIFFAIAGVMSCRKFCWRDFVCPSQPAVRNFRAFPYQIFALKGRI